MSSLQETLKIAAALLTVVGCVIEFARLYKQEKQSKISALTGRPFQPATGRQVVAVLIGGAALFWLLMVTHCFGYLPR